MRDDGVIVVDEAFFFAGGALGAGSRVWAMAYLGSQFAKGVVVDSAEGHEGMREDSRRSGIDVFDVTRTNDHEVPSRSRTVVSGIPFASSNLSRYSLVESHAKVGVNEKGSNDPSDMCVTFFVRSGTCPQEVVQLCEGLERAAAMRRSHWVEGCGAVASGSRR